MSSGKVVASLPDYKLIDDAQTRAFAKAVTDMMDVRNGDKGSGDHAFLTKADFAGLIGKDNFNLLTENPNSNVASGNGRRLSVAAAIRSLQRDIAGNPLSVYLSETIGLIKRPTTGVLARIDKIDVQFAATDATVAAIQTQTQTLTNNFAAQAQLITTVQARLDDTAGDGSNVSIEQKFLTLVNRDNFLLAQYTVKIDLNGYVVGFGLIAIDNGSGPTSLMLVRADRFAIGAPGLNAQIPFIVDATDHYDVNGIHHPNGAVYIEDGLFGQFIADYGNIGNLAVGSLKIKNDAVTVGSSSTVSLITVTDAYTEIASLTIDYSDENGNPIASGVTVTALVNISATSGPFVQCGFDLALDIDGFGTVAIFPSTVEAGGADSLALVYRTVTSGVKTFRLKVRRNSGTSTYATNVGALIINGAKK